MLTVCHSYALVLQANGWMWPKLKAALLSRWAPLGVRSRQGLCYCCVRKHLAFWLCERKTWWCVSLISVSWLKFVCLSPVKEHTLEVAHGSPSWSISQTCFNLCFYTCTSDCNCMFSVLLLLVANSCLVSHLSADGIQGLVCIIWLSGVSAT